MQPIFLILFSAITVLIAYQDFTERSVMWILFPALAIIGLVLNHTDTDHLQWVHMTVNFLFIAIQLGLLWLILLLFKNKPGFALSNKIGIGDILFFFASACFFTVEQYFLYHILSLVCALVVFVLFNTVRKVRTIPLAGLQSILLLIVKLVQYGRYSH